MVGTWDTAKLERAAGLMDRWIADGRVHAASILVTQRTDRRFARNFGAALGTEPVFLLASITKPMTTAVVMTLVDEGKLSLDDLVTSFFPAFTGDGRDQVTVRHLLTHTGGLPDMLADDESLRARHAPLSEFRDGALREPLLFAPGSHYSYASMGTLLSSEIAEQITGKPIAQLAEERLFAPLKMNRTALGLRGRADADTVASQAAPALTESGQASWASWNWNSAYWRALGAPWGGALGSAADVARFCDEFLFTRGRILPTETEKLMVINNSPEGVQPSGLGFDLPPAIGSPACGPATFGHNGSTGTLSWADPGTGTICVVLTSLYFGALSPHPMQLVSDLIAEAVAA